MCRGSGGDHDPVDTGGQQFSGVSTTSAPTRSPTASATDGTASVTTSESVNRASVVA